RTPDGALLDAAARGDLEDPTKRRAEAERLLADPRARDQWHRYHAEWLGYDEVAYPQGLEADMRQETAAPIDKGVFDAKRPGLHLLRQDARYVTPALATHYGLPPPAKADWVTYDARRGGGILSHGDFLLQGSKFGDTSPTLRGYRIYKHLLCGKLGT